MIIITNKKYLTIVKNYVIIT